MIKKSISILIPAFNEQGNMTALVSNIVARCREFDVEIVLINDGSTDGTKDEMDSIAKNFSQVRVVNLKRNFGQTAALAAGIDLSRGEIIVPLDADGQNDPSDITALLSKLDEGNDVVSGWRKDRKDNFFSRRLPSIIANKIISFVTGVHLHDYGCSLKAYRRSLLADVALYGEMHRFLPAWCVWQGGKVAEIPVTHHPRRIGKSKYGILRTFKVIIDLITIKFFSGYLAKPSYLFSGTGLLFLVLGGVSGALAIIDKMGPDRFPNFRIPLLLLSVFFGLGSIFLVLMGLLAELLVRLYFQARNQKTYRLADE